MVDETMKGEGSGGAERQGRTKSNNSLNPTGNSLCFMRESWRLDTMLPGRVNSGVRFLLNDLAQSYGLAFTSLKHQSYSCVLILVERCEPRADIEY
jgi:hypothetical protein